MSTSKTIKNALTLAHFLRRAKVLDLYRQFYRVTRRVESPEQRRDLRQWIRSEFRAKQQADDKELIEMYLSNGRNALRDLENSLRHAHAFKR